MVSIPQKAKPKSYQNWFQECMKMKETQNNYIPN